MTFYEATVVKTINKEPTKIETMIASINAEPKTFRDRMTSQMYEKVSKTGKLCKHTSVSN